MKKSVLYAILIIPIISGALLRVVFVNCFYISGRDLAKLQDKKDILVKENIELEKEVSYISSLSYIKESAQKEGMQSLSLEFLGTPILASR